MNKLQTRERVFLCQPRLYLFLVTLNKEDQTRQMGHRSKLDFFPATPHTKTNPEDNGKVIV